MIAFQSQPIIFLVPQNLSIVVWCFSSFTTDFWILVAIFSTFSWAYIPSFFFYALRITLDNHCSRVLDANLPFRRAVTYLSLGLDQCWVLVDTKFGIKYKSIGTMLAGVNPEPSVCFPCLLYYHPHLITCPSIAKHMVHLLVLQGLEGKRNGVNIEPIFEDLSRSEAIGPWLCLYLSFRPKWGQKWGQ